MTTVLSGGAITASAETIFYVTGVGCVSSYVLQQDGSIGSGCSGLIDQGFRMSGIVTLDAYGAPDGFNTGPASAYGTNWVTSSYQIEWTGPASGAYDGQLLGASSFERYAEVYNEIGYGQSLYASTSGVLDQGSSQASTYAYLIRITDPINVSWLSDLSFVEIAGLAPGPNATNWLSISRLSYTKDTATGQIQNVLPGSLSGTFIVTSMTAVPEPGVSATTMAGVAMLVLASRGARCRASRIAFGNNGPESQGPSLRYERTPLCVGWVIRTQLRKELATVP